MFKQFFRSFLAEPIINSFGIISIVYCFAYNFFLVKIPAFHSAFIGIGIVLVNLSYSYFAGYIFYRFQTLLENKKRARWFRIVTLPSIIELITFYDEFLNTLSPSFGTENWQCWNKSTFDNFFKTIDRNYIIPSVKIPMVKDKHNLTIDDAINDFILYSSGVVSPDNAIEQFYLPDDLSVVFAKLSRYCSHFVLSDKKNLNFWEFHSFLSEMKNIIEKDHKIGPSHY